MMGKSLHHTLDMQGVRRHCYKNCGGLKARENVPVQFPHDGRAQLYRVTRICKRSDAVMTEDVTHYAKFWRNPSRRSAKDRLAVDIFCLTRLYCR